MLFMQNLCSGTHEFRLVFFDFFSNNLQSVHNKQKQHEKRKSFLFLLSLSFHWPMP